MKRADPETESLAGVHATPCPAGTVTFVALNDDGEELALLRVREDAWDEGMLRMLQAVVARCERAGKPRLSLLR